MKRKDLKAGQWYEAQAGVVVLAGPELSSPRSSPYEDFRLGPTSTGRGLYLIGPEEPITPCDPPAWFGEVWVRREEPSKLSEPDRDVIKQQLEHLNDAMGEEAVAAWSGLKKGGSDE